MLYSLTLCYNICIIWLCSYMWTWVCVEEVDIWCLPQCSPLYFLDSLPTEPGAHQFDYTLASKSHESRLGSSCLCGKHCISWAVSLAWKSESFFIAQTSISLTPVLLPQLPKCWECQEPPYPHSSILIFFSSSLSQYRVSVCFFNYSQHWKYSTLFIISLVVGSFVISTLGY